MAMANDKCPEWADKLIMHLRDIEVKLGNIPDSPDWQTVKSVEDLQARTFPTLQEDEFLDNGIADRLFERIVMKLADEEHTVEDIVSYVNNRLCYKNGPPYCNKEEVALVLQ